MPPVWKAPVIFSSPHSGRCYHQSFLRQSRLNETALRSIEDVFVDILFGNAPKFGAPLIAATTPRSYVDINRTPEDWDPKFIAGIGYCQPSRYARAGYGVIPRLVGRGKKFIVVNCHNQRSIFA